MLNSLALAIVAAGTFLLYAYRTDFGKYSIATVGVYKRVTRTNVREYGHECRDCGGEIDRGERRQWFKEIVAFGAVVVRYGGGTGYYCHDHAAYEVRDDLQPVDELPTRTEKSVRAVVQVIVGLHEAQPDLPQKNESEFDDVVTAVDTGFQLLPVVFLVLIASVCLALFKGVRGAE